MENRLGEVSFGKEVERVFGGKEFRRGKLVAKVIGELSWWQT